MIKENVTKNDLLNIKVNKAETFTLPTWNHCRSAQSLAGQMKNSEPFPRFVTRIGDPIEGTQQRSITVTRIA